MSRTSIFEKRWLDLVFEGKNKAYGAYQLRLENPKTTLLAMLYALLFVGGTGGAITLLSSFGPKTDTGRDNATPIDEPITPVRVHLDEPERIATLKPKTTESLPAAQPATASWANPQIVTPTEATPEPPANVSAAVSPNENDGQPDAGGSPDGNASVATSGTGTRMDDTPAIPTTLQKQPMFPGGMDAFYKKIARDFEKPDMYEDVKIRIIMSFVVEKDGTMTNIKVLNEPGETLEKEAMRVLRSINRKWEPGIRNNQAVRTIFTLPIVIQPHQ